MFIWPPYQAAPASFVPPSVNWRAVPFSFALPNRVMLPAVNPPEKLIADGPDVVTVKFTPLLVTPPTFTTTFPVVAPFGTDVAMLVAVQLVTAATVPLNVT